MRHTHTARRTEMRVHRLIVQVMVMLVCIHMTKAVFTANTQTTRVLLQDDSAFEEQMNKTAERSTRQHSHTYGPSPREYLVALYVIPLWICLILICLRGSSRYTVRDRNNANAVAQTQPEEEGPRGLSSSSLDKIGKFSFRIQPTESRKDKFHITECSVCMDPFDEGDIIRQLPGCGHRFHMECVDEWLSQHPSCPICRMDTREALVDDIADGEPAPPGSALQMSASISGHPQGIMPSIREDEDGRNHHDDEEGVAQSPGGSHEAPGESLESVGNGTEGPSQTASHSNETAQRTSSAASSLGSSLMTWVTATSWLARARFARMQHGAQDEVLESLPSQMRNRARTFLRRQSLIQRQSEAMERSR